MGFYDAIRVGASGAASAYEIERSLRFNDDDSAYLNRTPSSAGNRRTMTLSVWVKGMISGTYAIFDAHVNDSNRARLFFNDNGTIQFFSRISNSDVSNLTTGFFRDPSAWYHLVFKIDTTQSTASDRYKIFVNGDEQETNNAFPSQNLEIFFNSTNSHKIGVGGDDQGNENYFDGYMAEINFLDGYAYDPSYFGETDPVTGQWNPKKYVGSYGTNGFYLNFSDNSGTTATTLGKDSSGNGNNFTPNNFSVSAGAGNDSLEDTPTNNFCTLNSVKKDGQTTLSNGNLQASGSQTSTYNINTQGTFAQSSGKWYYEVEFTSGSGSCAVGWARTTLRSSDNPTTGGGIVYRPTNGDYIDLAANNPTTPPTTSTGTVIQVAIDFDAGKIWFGSGGTYFNSGDPSTGSNEAMTFTGGSELLAPVVRTMAATFNFNFGQRAFSYTVPTGYQSLCSANLPDPTILLPNKHFDTVLYTGDGNATRTLSNVLEFQPDWSWSKSRNATYSHLLYDAVRGAGSLKSLTLGGGAATGAEGAALDNATYGFLNSFDANGFSFTKGSATTNFFNQSGINYVAWNWDAGETDGATYTVKVVSDSGNKYRFNDFGTSAVTLDLAEGGTYTFDQSDSSMSSHPMQLSTTANGTHGGGSAYSTGVTYQLDGSTVTASAFISGFSSASSRKLIITVAASAPTLYYYCYYHSGMGGQANTNSTLGSSNFDGSNQTTVKANTTSGFSIVLWTGTGSVASMGHGLGVAPKAIIIKTRSNATNWVVYHQSTGISKYLHLSNTDAAASASNYFADDSGNGPSSTVFYGRNDGNTSSQTMVAYCLSEVAGYSKFGSYTGNGNADGTFVFTGFRPAWVMLKRSDSADHWIIKDNKRNTTNDVFSNLGADITNAEFGSSGNVQSTDFLSNGFKLRGTDSAVNANNGTYVYFAFAESPFKNARAR